MHVTLGGSADALRAVVEDDGHGLPAGVMERDEGGLANLRTRVARTQGSLAASPRDGAGTRLSVLFPHPTTASRHAG